MKERVEGFLQHSVSQLLCPRARFPWGVGSGGRSTGMPGGTGALLCRESLLSGSTEHGGLDLG